MKHRNLIVPAYDIINELGDERAAAAGVIRPSGYHVCQWPEHCLTRQFYGDAAISTRFETRADALRHEPQAEVSPLCFRR